MAVRSLIRESAGIDAVAEETKISRSLIGNYNNRFHESMSPIDLILNLERDIESPIVTRRLARKQGYVLISTHAEEDAICAAILLARLGKETSDVFAEIGGAIEDGEMTQEEAPKCLNEVQDMLAEGNKLAKYLTNIIENKNQLKAVT